MLLSLRKILMLYLIIFATNECLKYIMIMEKIYLDCRIEIANRHVLSCKIKIRSVYSLNDK